ncbi:MAG: sugar ABC transporter permease [Treponema sp.]|jgi:raffinose/stachyose/melibiose transport system permease protein|nr:sugar ABC transporter permease [Treponema sp.]
MAIKKQKLELVECVLYSLPAMLLVTLMIYIPFVLSGLYSFTEWNGIARSPKWIGLANFAAIFKGESDFFRTLLFTFKYTFFFMIFANAIALALALALVRKFALANTLRGIFFVPYVISMTIVGFIWRFLFSSGFDTFYALTGAGIFKWSWLGEVNLAALSVVIVGVWQAIGFYVVLYIAGLEAIPSDVLEAAVVDGAAGFTRLRRIILPLLAPSIATCMFLSLTNSLKVFDIILALTRGGPAGSTYSVTLGIYRDAFQSNRYGLGSAESLLFFVIILILTQFVMKLFRPEEK